jgi:hypothetical protein
MWKHCFIVACGLDYTRFLSSAGFIWSLSSYLRGFVIGNDLVVLIGADLDKIKVIVASL